MKTSTRLLTAAALIACGVTAAAAPASAAYSIDPPSTPFTGTDLTSQTMKIGAAGPTWVCHLSLTGSSGATGQSWADAAPVFSGPGVGGSCSAGVLGYYSVVASGSWRMNVTGGGPGAGPYPVTLGLNGGSTLVIKPLTVPTCTITVGAAGNSAWSGLSAVNVSSPPGVRVYGAVSGIQYTASLGCPGVASGTRSDMVYDSGGNSSYGGISIPGVTLSGP